MQTRFPDKADFWKLTAAGSCLQGEIALHNMPRLTALLNDSAGQASVFLQAGVDESSIHFFTGCVKATVELICQRCMNSLPLSIAADFRLGLIHDEAEAAHLPEYYEPLVAPQGSLPMAEWIEDELILALPLIPMHGDARECEALGFVPLSQSPALPKDKVNPFASLTALLTGNKED